MESLGVLYRTPKVSPLCSHLQELCTAGGGGFRLALQNLNRWAGQVRRRTHLGRLGGAEAEGRAGRTGLLTAPPTRAASVAPPHHLKGWGNPRSWEPERGPEGALEGADLSGQLVGLEALVNK